MTGVQKPTFPGPFHHVSCETRLSSPCQPPGALAWVWDPLSPPGPRCGPGMFSGGGLEGMGWHPVEGAFCKRGRPGRSRFQSWGCHSNAGLPLRCGRGVLPGLLCVGATGHLRAGANAGEACGLVTAPLPCLGLSLYQSPKCSLHGSGGEREKGLGLASWWVLQHLWGQSSVLGPVATIAFGAWGRTEV